MRRLALVSLVAVSLVTPARADWRDHAIHLDMDTSPRGPRLVRGTALVEPMPFSRPSPATLPDFALVEPHQPRRVSGAVGEAILFEGGQYAWPERGTTNWLPPAVALGDDPEAWEPVDATVVAAPGARVGDSVLRVEPQREGGGLRTPPVRIDHPRERHFASVYARAAGTGTAALRLTVAAPSVDLDEATAPVMVGADWQRLSLRFELPAGASPDDLRLGILGDGRPFAVDAAMLEQASQHYHDRRTPSTWVPGLTHRYLDKTLLDAWPDFFDRGQGTIALWVDPLDQEANGTFIALGAGWTVPVAIRQDAAHRVTADFGNAKLPLGTAPPGQWTHLALVWADGTVRAYVNGGSVGDAAYDIDTLPDADALLQGHYKLGVGNEDLGRFARSTGANAALDEVWVSREAVDAATVAALAAGEAAAPSPRLDASALRRAWGREEPAGTLPLFADGAAAGTPVEVTLDDVELWRGALPSTAGPLPVPFRPADWTSGVHTLTVQVGDGTARHTFVMGPAKDAGRFPVIGWNVPSGQLADFATRGGTAANSSPDDQAAALHQLAGLYGMWLYGNLGDPPPGALPPLRVTQPNGEPGGVNLFDDRIAAPALTEAVGDAARTLRYPHLEYVLLNTEHSLPMDFSPPAQQQAHEATGIELAWWPLSEALLQHYGPQEIEAAEAGLVRDAEAAGAMLRPFNLPYARFLPAEHQPVDGAIKADNPLYRYVRWWYRERSLAAWNEDLAEAFRALNPDLTLLFDPILRGPSLRWYETMDLAQEWVYVENPLAMVPVQEALTTVSRDLGTRPTGMPQFLFKAGTAAPLSVTPPGDMMIEATWLACSRPIAGMTYWGWQLVYGPGDMWTAEQASEFFGDADWDTARARLKELKKPPHLWHPGALEAFTTLGETLFRPFGPLLQSWDNAPRRLAVVKSLASELFSDERWWTAHAYGPRIDAITALGVPYDVLYDEHITPAALARYDAVLLPAVIVLPEPALAALGEYGGHLVAEPEFAAHLPRAAAMAAWEPAALRDSLADAAPRTLAPLPEAAPAAVNHLVLGDAAFAVAVNDRREPGPLLGRWGKVAETGVAQTVTVGLPPGEWATVYDLTAGRRRTPEGETLALELPPAGGAIVGCYSQAFGELRVRAEAVGDTMALTLEAVADDGTPFRGPVPVTLTLTRPDGGMGEQSGSLLVRDGQATRTVLLPRAAAGAWTVTATEPLSGRAVRAAVQR